MIDIREAQIEGFQHVSDHDSLPVLLIIISHLFEEVLIEIFCIITSVEQG